MGQRKPIREQEIDSRNGMTMIATLDLLVADTDASDWWLSHDFHSQISSQTEKPAAAADCLASGGRKRHPCPLVCNHSCSLFAASLSLQTDDSLLPQSLL